MRRVVYTAVTLVALATTMLACSDEEVVPAGPPPTHSPSPSPTVPTRTSLLRYVSPSGDNHGPGSFDQPWRTLGYALGRLYLGQVLFVRGGSYHEQIDHVALHSGTSQAPITVLAYPGENPVLVGSVSLLRPDNWLIDNLDVTGDPSVKKPPAFMVKVIGGRDWTWQNSEFSDGAGSANVMITGWGFGEPAGFSFTGNCLHGLPAPPTSATNLFLGSMLLGAHGNISRNVVFNDDGQANVRIGSGAGAPVGVSLEQNTIYGGSLGIDVRGHPHDVRISRNVIGGSHAPAMIRYHRGVPRGTTVTNNVAVNALQLLRPEVRKIVHGYGNVVVPQDPEFADTQRCSGFRAGLDALIPYGAFAP